MKYQNILFSFKERFSKFFLSFFFLFFLLFTSCENYGRLKVTSKLSKVLEEVSGIQFDTQRDAFWMLNDGGNKSRLYLVSETGAILRALKMNAKNTDWEDITQDKAGNLYIGDFGNNANKRKELCILKVRNSDLERDQKIAVEKISFFYPEQKEYPSKEMYFDTEAFFEWNGFFYMFTKSRVKKKIGRTFLYKIPNKEGNHRAERISDFTTCPNKGCWITGADISKDGKKVVLLNHISAWVFTNFTDDDFFSGDVREYQFNHESQKESITFKNDSVIYLADESEANTGRGRNLYLFQLD